MFFSTGTESVLLFTRIHANAKKEVDILNLTESKGSWTSQAKNWTNVSSIPISIIKFTLYTYSWLYIQLDI